MKFRLLCLHLQPLVIEAVTGNTATVILAGAPNPNNDISSYIVSDGDSRSTIVRAATHMLKACENKKGSSISLTWCKVVDPLTFNTMNCNIFTLILFFTFVGYISFSI